MGGGLRTPNTRRPSEVTLECVMSAREPLSLANAAREMSVNGYRRALTPRTSPGIPHMQLPLPSPASLMDDDSLERHHLRTASALASAQRSEKVNTMDDMRLFDERIRRMTTPQDGWCHSRRHDGRIMNGGPKALMLPIAPHSPRAALVQVRAQFPCWQEYSRCTRRNEDLLQNEVLRNAKGQAIHNLTLP